MPEIFPDHDVVTLINVLTVDPERQDDLVDLLIASTEGSVRERPGFVSASIHPSLDGSRVVNYAQWRTEDDFLAMARDPETRKQLAAARAIVERNEPNLYRVACTATGTGTERSVAQISPDLDVVTLFNVITVRPERQQRLADLLVAATENETRELPGFVSASIHTSLDGTSVVNYAQWRTPDDFRAMAGNPAAQKQLKEARSLIEHNEPHLYRVAFTATGR